ncbi:gamma-glutamyltransferase [Legionella dresdenensis]|uniref:Glutathione hydrolase proenzyme n=1 Tax=Legionella dresdenensis TaxID=450200 RepID=A0ABV8CFI2_9GAMM
MLRKAALLALICLISSMGYAQSAVLAEKPPGYAVASAHPLATQAGLEILAAGGNAFDAAVAVSAALAVVEPYHSGLGGGGFWLLHNAGTKENIVVDGREVAPLAASQDMFLDKNGDPVPGLSLNGGLAAGIPGEPAALVYIAGHYGRLPLSASLAPAIRLAEQGFLVDEQFIYFCQMMDRLEILKRYPASSASYLNNGKVYKPGERLRQPDLAKTLKRLAEQGQKGFYQGETAQQLVKGNRDAGGIWTLNDLARYQVKIREPLQGAYHNMLIITVPPPSAGGTMLIMMLNMLANYPLTTFSRVQYVHYLVEVMRLAFWQSNQTMADPGFVKIPLSKLLSAGYAKGLTHLINPDKATPSSKLSTAPMPAGAGNTTHIAILDQEGNRVSATMSVNYIFGSGVVAAGTGVLLNDHMDDFAVKPGVKNVFGVVGSQLNAIAPGKRPLSNMTPTFLEMPGRLAIVGTPGGSRIPTMVLLASLWFNDYSGAITMVSGMRFHHQYLPDVIQFEPDTFSDGLQTQLRAMGYQLMALKQYYGDMQAISWDKKLNVITAASDPRRMGLATVVSVNPEGYGVNH